MKDNNIFRFDPVLERYKSEEFLCLIKKWAGSLDKRKILKTDLQEEAFSEDCILFSLSGNKISVFAVDISEEVTKNACIRSLSKGFFQKYLTADVKKLPFKDNFFDLILSTSTLDHFVTEYELTQSLVELKRVLKPDGIMILTIQNKHNYPCCFILSLKRVFNLINYNIQSYSMDELVKVLQGAGLNIEQKDAIVHIINPANSFLGLLRVIASKESFDKIANKLILFFHRLGKRKKSKWFTGWFIAAKCSK